jgi:hypothetical protein
MTPDEALAAAWTHCAPNRVQELFPTGFWPDVARVAMEMFAQQTTTPKLDFRPTLCSRGDYPEPKAAPSKRLKGLDLGKMEFSI